VSTRGGSEDEADKIGSDVAGAEAAAEEGEDPVLIQGKDIEFIAVYVFLACTDEVVLPQADALRDELVYMQLRSTDGADDDIRMSANCVLLTSGSTDVVAVLDTLTWARSRNRLSAFSVIS
jgi:hypothetical protein